MPSLFGLAPGGVFHANSVTRIAVRSYRTISPLPSFAKAMPGGIFSAALSLRSPSPDVIRHRVSMEPGLSSPLAQGSHPTLWFRGQYTPIDLKNKSVLNNSHYIAIANQREL